MLKRFIFALAALLALAPSHALAQSSPNFSYGQVPTAGQWNAAFASKQDRLNFTPLSTTGGTMTGKFYAAPSTVNGSGFAFLPGVAPTSPINGDAWVTSAGFFVQVNGQTTTLLPVGTTAGTVAAGNDSRIVGAVRSDVAQSLSGAAQRLARVNIGAFGINTTYVNSALALNQNQSGNCYNVDGATITLPPASIAGLVFGFVGGSTGGNIVTSSGVIYAGTNVTTTLSLKAGDTAVLVSDGGSWVAHVFGRNPDGVVLADRGQSFTPTQQVQAYTNLGSTPGAAGTILTSNGAGAAPTFQAIPASGGGAPVLGQARLIYSSASALLVKPYQGNQITVNGAAQTVPSAGVTCSNAGLTANSLYYAYLYVAGSTLTCEMVTTTHATSTTNGVEQKSGDATRTLVGMAYMGAGTPGTFVDSAAQRYVASWFNRRPRDLFVAATAAGTTSGTPVEVSTANRAAFIAWPDGTALANLVGLQNSNTAGSTNTTTLALDGTAIGNPISHYMPAANVSQAVSVAAQVTPAEGVHYFNFLSSVNGNTGVWSAAVGGSVWQ